MEIDQERVAIEGLESFLQSMSSFKRNPFLLALTLSLVVLAEVATSPAPATGNVNFHPDPYIKVEIFNQLSKGATFTIHCKSGDFDLGVNVVQPGRSYWFRFKVNWFQTTLYFCGFSWKGGRVVFDVYTAKRDLYRCATYCKWQVKEEFILGFRQNKELPDMAIPWK